LGRSVEAIALAFKARFLPMQYDNEEIVL